jgi:hypothetical protein
MKDYIGTTFRIIFGTLLIFLGIFLGYSSGLKDTRQAAVDHRAATWIVDQKTGSKGFKWNDEIIEKCVNEK